MFEAWKRKRPKLEIPNLVSFAASENIASWVEAVNACNNEGFKQALNDVLQQARVIQLDPNIDHLGCIKGIADQRENRRIWSYL